MSTLHMEIETVKDSNNELKHAYVQLQEILTKVNIKFAPVFGNAWMGNSASNYAEELNEWLKVSSEQLEKLKGLADNIDHEIAEWESMAMSLDEANFIDNFSDRSILRNWWHNLLRNHGKYSSYAVFLVLPSDKTAINYLTDCVSEIDLLTGNNCLALIFGKNRAKSSNMDKESWSKLVQEYVIENYSTQLAGFFEIPFTQFPCLVIFKDIRSQEHVVISFKNMTTDEISETMRAAFATIIKSVSTQEDPIRGLRAKKSQEKLRKAGVSVISEVRAIAGKTLETVMDSVISSSIKPK